MSDLVRDLRDALAPDRVRDGAVELGLYRKDASTMEGPAGVVCFPLSTAEVQSCVRIARRHGACLTLHGDAALAKTCGVDGVHLSAGGDPVAARNLLGPGKLIGVSLHTVTEAEALDPAIVDYAIAGPAFETASKPGYGPEIGRKGLSEIAAAAGVPVLAIGGLNATRAAEVLAAGPLGIAVMGGVMRASDPGQEVRALLAIVAGATAYPRPR